MYKNDPAQIEHAVQAFRSLLDGGGTVIALFPITDEEWGMSVAMSENTPEKILEQLGEALIMGKFEMQQARDEEG